MLYFGGLILVSLNVEQICLIELLKASLFDITPVFPENVYWKKVFELAKAQCIVPLISPCVPSEHKTEWLEISFQSKAHFIKLMYEQNMLSSLFNDMSIPFVIIKGTAAAVYYPNPSLRTFGDIDFYVKEDYLELAKKTLEQNGYALIHNNERHYGYEKNGIEFELHTRFSCQEYNNIDHIILCALNNRVEYKIMNSSFPGLPSSDNGLILLGHIMQHFKGSGIGLRQIIDWMMFVCKDLDDSSWECSFKSLAKDAGLEKLAITVTYMCKKWLGLPNSISWCNNADEHVAEQMLIRILDDGNFGRDRSPSESIKESIKKEGFIKYLQRSGLVMWPLAQKYAVFRPFAWLYQLCRYACKGITGLFTGKKVFMKNKHNMSLEELWERLE